MLHALLGLPIGSAAIQARTTSVLVHPRRVASSASAWSSSGVISMCSWCRFGLVRDGRFGLTMSGFLPHVHYSCTLLMYITHVHYIWSISTASGLGSKWRSREVQVARRGGSARCLLTRIGLRREHGPRRPHVVGLVPAIGTVEIRWHVRPPCGRFSDDTSLRIDATAGSGFLTGRLREWATFISCSFELPCARSKAYLRRPLYRQMHQRT